MNSTPRPNDLSDANLSASRTVAPRGGARGPRWRWLALGAPLLTLGAAATLWALKDAERSAAAATRPADVPRVEGASITFSKAFAERAGLKLAPAVRAELVPLINAVGTLDFNPEHVAAVGARLRGLVTQVLKFEGDSVEPGTVLAVIESGELGEAQAAVSTLEAEKLAADRNLARERALADKKLSTAREAEVAEVEAERYDHLLGAARQKVSALIGGVGSRSRRLGSHELRSPMKGTVVARNVAPGQAIEGDVVAFRVANVEHLWVEIEVFEKNLGLLGLGDRVELSPLAAPSETFEGRLARIGAVIDTATRSAPVRVEIENKNGRLRAGQAVNATIHGSGGGARERTLVPTTALTFVDGKPTLFVASGEHRVRVASVDIGATNGAQTEVVNGVAPGEQVVAEGVFALKSELFR
jgi:cobalt-zinc-cadmium efflux system membrane fusion protein